MDYRPSFLRENWRWYILSNLCASHTKLTAAKKLKKKVNLKSQKFQRFSHMYIIILVYIQLKITWMNGHVGIVECVLHRDSETNRESLCTPRLLEQICLCFLVLQFKCGKKAKFCIFIWCFCVCEQSPCFEVNVWTISLRKGFVYC